MPRKPSTLQQIYTPAFNRAAATGQQQMLNEMMRKLDVAGQTVMPCIDFSRDVLGHDPWSTPIAIMNAIDHPNASVAVKACHASSKCVAASDLITLADGRRMQAAQLIDQRFDLLSLQDGEVAPVAAYATLNVIAEPVYRVTLETGRTITRNAQHPVWTADGVFPNGNRCKIESKGFRSVIDLTPGALVAVADDFPAFGQRTMTDDELTMLAYLIGDGGYTNRGVVFSQQDGVVLDECRDIAGRMGAKLMYRSGVDHRITGDGVTRRESGHLFNPVAQLLDDHRLRGTHSRDKRVPTDVFTQDRGGIRLFLNRLYATDGWASVAGSAPQIGFCSASEGLIRDIQDLLIRFGIVGRIEIQKDVAAWKLMIATAGDVIRFCEVIGIHGKDDAVTKVYARAQQQAGTRQVRKWRWKNAPPRCRWERVVSVDRMPDEATVAITVPDGNTYLSPVYEHNTFTAAEVVLWFVKEVGGIVVSTAPTYMQVTRMLWGEIKTAYQNALRPLGGTMLDQAAELRYTATNYAFGMSTDEGVRMQGFHGNKVLFVLDEAPGIKPNIWEAIEGARAGGDVRVLAIGNPVTSGGPFYAAFNRERALWKTFTIDAFDTPNLAGLTEDDIYHMDPDDPRLQETVRPYLITRDWVKKAMIRWGLQSGAYRSRVRGQFPGMGEDQLIAADWVDAMARREIPIVQDGAYEAGIDVAGEGEDETVCTVRHGTYVWPQKGWGTPNPEQEVIAMLVPHRERARTYGKKFLVKVDGAGLGHYFISILRKANFDVMDVRAVQKPKNPDRFANAKAEFHWELRERMEDGDICGSLDDIALGQLTSIRWELNGRGLIEIESKLDMKKRGMPSPDYAESLMLAFYRGTTMAPGTGIFGGDSAGAKMKRRPI